jgi:hypothetical protein
MSSNSWVNYGIGLVAGIAVGFLTAGLGFGAYALFAGAAAFSATSTILNATFARPKMPTMKGGGGGFGNSGSTSTGKDAAAAQLSISSATEAVAIPVIFGRCRMQTNILRYDRATYRSVPIIQRVQRDPAAVAYAQAQKKMKSDPDAIDHVLDDKAEKQQEGQSSGGKGGQPSQPPPSQQLSDFEKVNAYSQVLLERDQTGKKKLPIEYDEYIVGYNYYLSWELGICMGPIDAIFQVLSYPGEEVVSAPNTGMGVDVIAITAKGREQGGGIFVYRGSATQARTGGDPYAHAASNYRNCCFAVCSNYWMGQQPVPPSLAFDVQRFPVCLDAVGAPVAGMQVRGSTNPAHPSFNDANPAAILYEIFTNKIWGRGIHPDDIDVASFVSASVFFATNSIGMSFSLEAQDIVSEAVDTIRTHVNTLVIWVGDKLKCKCLLDRANAYSPMVQLTSDNLAELEFTRGSWPSTINELRADFLNAYNNFQSEIVMAQDLANMATVGRINSQKISLVAFSNRDTAQRMVNRLLPEMAYPQATGSFRMNRFETRLEPGGCFALTWNEWSAGPVTNYCRVTNITDDDLEGNGVRVDFVEDQYMTPTAGVPDTFEPVVPPYESGPIPADDDVVLGEDQTADFDTGNLLFELKELPLWLTDGDRFFAIFCQRENGMVQGVNFFWRETGSGDDFASLGSLAPWSMFGELNTALASTGSVTVNRTRDTFEILLEREADRARFLSAASRAPTDSDHLDTVAAAEQNWLIIGNEMMQVVQAEAGVAANSVIVTAYIRGQYSTDREAHSVGARTIFFTDFIPYVFTFRHDAMPLNVSLDFKAVPYSYRGENGDEYNFTATLTNRARRPMPVEIITRDSVVGATWAMRFRPRFHNRGADAIGELEESLETYTGAIPEGYEFYVMPQTAGGANLLSVQAKVVPTLIPDDSVNGTDPTKGMVTFSYDVPPTTGKLLLYQALNGVLGYPTTFTP